MCCSTSSTTEPATACSPEEGSRSLPAPAPHPSPCGPSLATWPAGVRRSSFRNALGERRRYLFLHGLSSRRWGASGLTAACHLDGRGHELTVCSISRTCRAAASAGSSGRAFRVRPLGKSARMPARRRTQASGGGRWWSPGHSHDFEPRRLVAGRRWQANTLADGLFHLRYRLLASAQPSSAACLGRRHGVSRVHRDVNAGRLPTAG